MTPWVSQAVGAALFLSVGAGKPLSYPDHVTAFAQIGVGQWLRYAVGAAEVAVGAILLVPRTVGFAVLGPTVIVADTAFTDVFAPMDDGWMSPLALTAAMAAAAWLHHPETAQPIGRGTVR